MTGTQEIKAIDVGDLLIQIVDEPETVVGGGVGGTAAVGAGALIDRLDDVGEKIGEVCARLHATALQKMSGAKPKTLEIEFGITLAGEAGIPFVTSGSVETSFTVKATWEFGTAALGGDDRV